MSDLNYISLTLLVSWTSHTILHLSTRQTFIRQHMRVVRFKVKTPSLHFPSTSLWTSGSGWPGAIQGRRHCHPSYDFNWTSPLRAVLGSQQSSVEGTQQSRLPLHPVPQPPPLSTSPTRLVRWLWSPNLHWQVIITRSQACVRVTPGAVHSAGLDKRMVTCVHHSNPVQSSLTALNVLCAPSSL